MLRTDACPGRHDEANGRWQSDPGCHYKLDSCQTAVTAHTGSYMQQVVALRWGLRSSNSKSRKKQRRTEHFWLNELIKFHQCGRWRSRQLPEKITFIWVVGSSHVWSLKSKNVKVKQYYSTHRQTRTAGHTTLRLMNASCNIRIKVARWSTFVGGFS